MTNLNSNTVVRQCLDILKSENIKKELNLLFRPFIEIIMIEMNPYIYIIILLLISTFLLNLGICMLLLHKFNHINVATGIFSSFIV